ESCLSEYANYMERYYTTNLSYAKDAAGNANKTLPDLGCASAQQTGSNYSYQFDGDPTATTYTVEAIPQGAQAARDTACGTLSLDQTGKRAVSGAGSLEE